MSIVVANHGIEDSACSICAGGGSTIPRADGRASCKPTDHIFTGGVALHIRNDAAPAAEFERWLFVHAASVILSDKAGELLTFSLGDFGKDEARLVAGLHDLAQRWSFEYLILHRTETTIKFIVYHSQRVREQLRATPPCTLCDALGYCAGIEPSAFLVEIANRWQTTGEIPHEVGLALGYPVKDVLGFMGQNDLACTGQCGWRVYGNPAPSLAANQRFQSARVQAMRHVAVMQGSRG